MLCSGAGREPDADLPLGRFDGVRAVDDVLLDLLAPVPGEVAPDGAGSGLRRIGRARERAEAADDALAGRDDGDHGSGPHDVDERLVEGLALVLLVVRRELGIRRVHELEAVEAVALPLD